MRKLSHIGGGTEPYPGREYVKYLEDKYDAKMQRNTGSSHFRMLLPDGRTVPAMPPTAPVQTRLARHTAAILGVSLQQMREEIGYPTQKRRKGRVQSEPQRPASRRDVIRLLTELRRELTFIEQQVKTGDRDPSVYRRAHASLDGALEEAGHFRRSQQVIQEAHENGSELD